MKKNKENGSQNPRARVVDWLDRSTGTFIGRLIFEIIPTILKPFVADPIAILIAVVQSLWKLTKAVLDLLKKERNPEDEPIEAEDLFQPDEENFESATGVEADAVPGKTTDHEAHLPQYDRKGSEPVTEAEMDAAQERTMNATASTTEKPV